MQFSPPALAGPSSKLAALTHQVDMKVQVMRNYRAIAVGELICLPRREPADLTVMNQYLPESSEERPYPPSPVESDGSASPRTEPTSTRDRVDASDSPASPLSLAAQALGADAVESLTPVPPRARRFPPRKPQTCLGCRRHRWRTQKQPRKQKQRQQQKQEHALLRAQTLKKNCG